LRTLIVLVGAAALGVVALAMFLDEGEVVRLLTTDPSGQIFETRLWIVDVDGSSYVRSAGAGSIWLSRLEIRPDAELERSGENRSVRAVSVSEPRVRDAVNEAMRTKYGILDWLSLGLHYPAQGVAVRLDEGSTRYAAPRARSVGETP
jgi:hypothetical protein